MRSQLKIANDQVDQLKHSMSQYNTYIQEMQEYQQKLTEQGLVIQAEYDEYRLSVTSSHLVVSPADMAVTESLQDIRDESNENYSVPVKSVSFSVDHTNSHTLSSDDFVQLTSDNLIDKDLVREYKEKIEEIEQELSTSTDRINELLNEISSLNAQLTNAVDEIKILKGVAASLPVIDDCVALNASTAVVTKTKSPSVSKRSIPTVYKPKSTSRVRSLLMVRIKILSLFDECL